MSQTRRNHSVSLLQASRESPTFARLADLAMESSARLQSVQPLIPVALRRAVRAGPIDGTSWCLILDNNAVAAKMRQLIPSLQSHLRSKGWEVTAIRMKIQMPDQAS
jgi:hypothetical protein